MVTPVSTVPDADRLVVLIVEDDADTREMYRYYLEAFGVTVHEAGDGREGIEKARALAPDVILTDILLPQLDGLHLCRELKRDARTRPIALLAVSGYSKSGIEQEARGAGFESFLLKPCLPDRLLAEVRKAAAVARRARALLRPLARPNLAAFIEHHTPGLFVRLFRYLRHPSAA